MNKDDYGIPGASEKKTVDGKHYNYKLKTPHATFSFKPISNEPQAYLVQVTSQDLPGIFKNSGRSSFGWFKITRYLGRNAVIRPRNIAPTAGNAVLMWPNLEQAEKNRCLEYLEKLLRSEIPRLISDPK